MTKSEVKKVVGITGSSGFLGKLVKKKLSKLSKYNIRECKVDITKKNSLKNWFKKNECDYFIHLAAIVPVNTVRDKPKLAKKVNILGTKNIISEINSSKKIKWFFFASSSHIYKFNNNKLHESSKKDPFSLYGKTKLTAENFIKKNIDKNIKSCCGRIFSLEGKKKGESYFLPSLVKKIKKNYKVELNGNIFRDFIHVEDVVRAIIMLMDNEIKGNFNIASGKKIKFISIIKIIKKYTKIDLNFISIKSNSLSAYANIKKIQNKIKWKPQKNIEFIIKEYLNIS